ncbi:hypothetical protein DERF_007257 [Dermatophagoides farinae]|uniref:Uncharacterized protein n=1 Tax=Dermatophagoides farinae TaxID=6954 RepID=A0A922L7T1_DERFA|nr:hypothetical protein DERF_007257 [Dermatophagoides farinae]
MTTYLNEFHWHSSSKPPSSPQQHSTLLNGSLWTKKIYNGNLPTKTNNILSPLKSELCLR